MSIPHIWCKDAPKSPLVSMQHGFIVAALGAGTGAALVIFMAKIISDYEHLTGVPKFLLESLVHRKTKASNHDFQCKGIILCSHLKGTVFGLL